MGGRGGPRYPAVYICETDDSACECAAPKDTPGGMHPNYCPANPMPIRPHGFIKRSDGRCEYCFAPPGHRLHVPAGAAAGSPTETETADDA